MVTTAMPCLPFLGTVFTPPAGCRGVPDACGLAPPDEPDREATPRDPMSVRREETQRAMPVCERANSAHQ